MPQLRAHELSTRSHARRWLAACGLALALAIPASAAPDALEMYFIDTEGGQATLLVAPSGETFLIDVGFAGLDTPNPDKDVARDAGRIADVARIAGVTRLDTVLVTHFHGDHASGISHLQARLPIGTFVDHGPAVQDVPPMRQKVGEYSEFWAAAFAKGQHRSVAAGDRLTVRGLDVTIVQASGKPTATAGAPNTFCQGVERRMDGNPEDTASIGVVVQYGKFRYANFGDLPWNQELDLLCPSNRVGQIDVYQARHGGEPSAAAYGMAPRVTVFDNGPRKGGGPVVLKAFRSSPGFQDVWQLHKNIVPGGADANPPDEFSANLQDTDDTMHQAHYLKLTAREDGSFTMLNSRTGLAKSYGVRPGTGGSR